MLVMLLQGGGGSGWSTLGRLRRLWVSLRETAGGAVLSSLRAQASNSLPASAAFAVLKWEGRCSTDIQLCPARSVDCG